jgi:RNA polymerase sigma-70 factor (ECF subfamily)
VVTPLACPVKPLDWFGGLLMPDANKRFYAELWPHAAAILRTAQFLCHNDAEADDLVQEVMLKAFRHIDQLVDPSGAKAWLMTILRTTRLDRIRAAGKAAKDISLHDLVADPAANESHVPDPVWDEPESLLQAFSDRQVIDALKKLPEDIRWTLMLVDIEGVDQAEAAEILQVPVGTIKSRASRGRGMLRVALTPLAKELRMTR